MDAAAPLSGLSGSPAPQTGNERAQLREAAQRFEAIFLRQMLAAARKTDFGGGDLFGGAGLETFTEMRDERFAEIAAQTGAFGLADQIEAHLARFLTPEGGEA